MTREEAIRILASSCIPGSKQTEALETLIPELKESEDERIRKEILAGFKFERDTINICINKHEADKRRLKWLNGAIAYLEKQKEANKAIEAVARIDKYIDENTTNAHDMKDSHPDKKYCQGIDNTLSDIAGILQDVYSEDENKTNNRVDNLEWCDRNYNMQYGKNTHLQRKPVAQYSLDGKLIRKYESIKDAAIATGIYPTNIGKCATGRIYNKQKGYYSKTAGGFIWKLI